MVKDWERFGLKPHLSKNERLPKSYKEVEKVLKDVKACKGNLKTVLNNSRLRGCVFKKVYALATNVLKYRHILDKIIQETELLKKETFLREELAGILIYDLVYGKGLPGESRPVTVVKQYETLIRKAYENAMVDDSLNVKGLQSLPRYVRVNTLLTSVFDVLRSLRKNGYREVYYGENTSEKEYLDLVRNLETGCYLIDYHFKDLLVFASTENLTTWSFFKKHFVYIQDKSSYIPVHALNPKPGSVVIDACAAPGMKTIHIAAAMENNGRIYAFEKSENRFQILKDMLDRATVQICETSCEDFYLVNTNNPNFKDLEYILVDPSCSGSGMVNRMDTVTDTEDSKNVDRLLKLAGFQILLLKHALAFPSVKRVVYSTCSISEEENEYVVHEVLNHYRHLFKLVSVMPDWPVRGHDNFEFGKLCLRAYPEETLTNGFFVAMFERLDYDEHLNATMSFSEKPSKKKRKKGKNLDEKDCHDVVKQNEKYGSHDMDYNDSELQDNPQSFSSNASDESRNFSKRKNERAVETDFNETFTEDKEHIPFENDKGKKKKCKKEHSFESDDNHSKKKKNKRNVKEPFSDNVDLDNLNECSADSHLLKKECVIVNDLIENNAEDDYIPSRKDKRKKKYNIKDVSICENVDLVEDNKSDAIEQTILESTVSGEETNTKVKKHKHKKKHSKDVEDCYILEPVTETNLPECEGTEHKKKHKRKHSKRDFQISGNDIEIKQDVTVHENSLHEEEASSSSVIQGTEHKKKHKRKHSKRDLEISGNDIEIKQEVVTDHENSLHEEEASSLSVIRHKKKHSTLKNTENVDTSDENVNKTMQVVEETTLKKKHKKCKYKRVKDE